MSVFVSDFSTTPWTVIHDEAGHTGTIDPATIKHTLNMDSSENHNFLIVTCPVCQAVSTHPVGGGAQPELVQQLFVHKATTIGCPCGQVLATDPDSLGESHVRLNVNRMDGPGRWRLG